MNETNGNPGNLISLRDIHKNFDRLEVKDNPPPEYGNA